MKKPIKLKLIHLLFISTITITSCFVASRISEEYDIVDSSSCIRLSIYARPVEKRTQVESYYKTIYKRIDSNNLITYEVYDYFTLGENSFPMKEKVYVIADNQVFLIKLKSIYQERRTGISEQKSSILNSDSVYIPVVTDYSVTNKVYTKMSYFLTDKVIEKIRNSNEILFRYYNGPQMITIKLRKKQIKKFKELIERIF